MVGVKAELTKLRGAIPSIWAKAVGGLKRASKMRPKMRGQDFVAMLMALMRAGGRRFFKSGIEVKLMSGFLAVLALISLVPIPAISSNPPEPIGPLAESGSSRVPVSAAQESWRSIPVKFASYGLDAPEIAGTRLNYRLRTLSTGVRQDLLHWEAPDDRQSVWGTLSIDEAQGESVTLTDNLYVDIARRAALVGSSITRMSQPTHQNSKFGTLEVADTQLLQKNQPQSCLAYRLVEARPINIQGFFCGTAKRPMDRAALTCILDRVDLVSAGKNNALREWFAEIERSRKSCSGFENANIAGFVDRTAKPVLKETADNRLDQIKRGR